MEGKLIVEVYEYAGDSISVPAFTFIPCELSKCLKGKSATLKDIIQRGFDDLPRKEQDTDKRQDILRLLEDASIGRINVAYIAPKGDTDPRVELTNVEPVSMSFADARQMSRSKENIILRGRYKLSPGNEVTSLCDAQRLTLIYTDFRGNEGEDGMEESGEQREIRLNITYLQD